MLQIILVSGLTFYLSVINVLNYVCECAKYIYYIRKKRGERWYVDTVTHRHKSLKNQDNSSLKTHYYFFFCQINISLKKVHAMFIRINEK